MSLALFGILQLDRGDPYGYGQLLGLLQAWLQDAGGFAFVGLVVYLIYALYTPTDKSESERLRVPVSRWMLITGAIALICYAGVFALLLLGKGAIPMPPPPQPGEPIKIEPPTWHTQQQPMLLMIAGFFSLLAIGEPFARDLLKITRRNVSFNLSGVRRFGQTLNTYTSGLFTRSRVIAILAALGIYALAGVALFAIGVPRLTGIWTWLLVVGAAVFLAALFLLLLFEAEGPMWAVAKLSFKEAVRKRVLWVFVIIFLPFLFPSQWFAADKASDELRNTTLVATFFLSLLTLLPAVLLASFGIPDDIKNLNIFTVVSKPVERFEIVLGRFIGYLALMTLVMLALTGISLVLITNTSISEKAREETYKARVPLRGKLEFRSLRAEERQEKREFEGTNVGREFDYRRYIAGHPQSPQRGIWKFSELPAQMERAQNDAIPVEFTFDVYRMTKGEQDKGVLVNFTIVTQAAPQQPPAKNSPAGTGSWEWVSPTQREAYEARVNEYRSKGVKLDDARPGDEAWEAVNKLAEEFGYYEFKGKRVLDYTVMGVEIPAGLFRNANNPNNKPGVGSDGKPLPKLLVYVKCESEGQLLGMAEPDLYLLQNEMPYALNYVKSMIGVWCRLCIVIAVAVAASTYLSGVLSLLLTLFIYIVGLFTDHLNDIASSRNIGGPFQSLSQILKAEQPTAPITDTAGTKALLLGDKFAAWVFRRIQNIIPDVDSFSWSHFVSEGFNVNTEYLVLNVIFTFGYLLPWAILAYYLMKSREVAA